MDNPSFEKDKKLISDTELKIFPSDSSSININSINNNSNGSANSCRPDVCSAVRQRYPPPDLDGSPWHKHKTYFLITILIIVIVWFIVYSILGYSGVL